MRLIATDYSPPRNIRKLLTPNEKQDQVITVHMHPAVLFAPVVIALAGLIGVVVLNNSLKSQNPLMTVIWLAWGILLARAVWAAATWSVERFVVTSQRMMLTSGLLTRKVAMMPLVKVTDMSFQRSLFGQLFGYGEFILESAGQEQALRNIPFIPYPDELYVEVCKLIFPSKDEPSEDDGDD